MTRRGYRRYRSSPRWGYEVQHLSRGSPCYILKIWSNVNPLFPETLTFPLPIPRPCACIMGRLPAAPCAANEKLPGPFAWGGRPPPTPDADEAEVDCWLACWMLCCCASWYWSCCWCCWLFGAGGDVGGDFVVDYSLVVLAYNVDAESWLGGQ